MNVDAHLSADRITRALSALNAELARADTNAELCLFGGTVMVLAFRARPATKDVDAIFEPKGPVRAAAQRVAEGEGLPDDWLNDPADQIRVKTRHLVESLFDEGLV